LEKTNTLDVKSEVNKSNSANEKTIVKEPTNDKASNSSSKQKETSKIDNKFVTTESKSEKTKISSDKNVDDKALANKNLSINEDKNLPTSIKIDNSLSEKDSTNKKSISITEVKSVTKPIFIPEEKKPLKKAEVNYKSSDFIPASDLVKSDKSKVNSKDFKVSGENSTSVTNENSTSKPQFIPSTKPQISETSDLDRLLKEMKAKVNGTLSTEKAKNAATSNNLENKGDLSKEKTIKENNNNTSNPILLKFSIATIEKSERLTFEIPKTKIILSSITSNIYFVPQSDRIIHLNWSWLDKFIMN